MSCLKFVIDISLLVIYRINQKTNWIYYSLIVKRFYIILLILFYSLIFTLTKTRFNNILGMIFCKEKENFDIRKEYSIMNTDNSLSDIQCEELVN